MLVATLASLIILGMATAEKDIHPPTLREPQAIAREESTWKVLLLAIRK